MSNKLRDIALVLSGSLISAIFTYYFYFPNTSTTRAPLKKISNPSKNCENVELRVLIHGGAGVIAKEIDGTPYYQALAQILKSIRAFGERDDVCAVDVVEFAVVQLENEPLFNAGRGAVFTADDTHGITSFPSLPHLNSAQLLSTFLQSWKLALWMALI